MRIVFFCPFWAKAFSITAGGILEPLRNPGIVTCFEHSFNALLYADWVSLPGTWIVTFTADSRRYSTIYLPCSEVITIPHFYPQTLRLVCLVRMHSLLVYILGILVIVFLVSLLLYIIFIDVRLINTCFDVYEFKLIDEKSVILTERN